MSEKVSRRNVLNSFLWGSITAWSGFILYPIVAYLKPPPQSEAVTSSVRVDALDQFPPDSGRIIPFGRKPALVIRVGIENSAESFRAYYATCTHLDCTVKYRKDLKGIFCECHNGMYDLNGINISGPPPRPLAQLKVNILDGEIYISREA